MCGFDSFGGGFGGDCGPSNRVLQAEASQINNDITALTTAVLSLCNTGVFTANAYEVGASCLNGQILLLPGEPITSGDLIADDLVDSLTFALN